MKSEKIIDSHVHVGNLYKIKWDLLKLKKEINKFGYEKIFLMKTPNSQYDNKNILNMCRYDERFIPFFFYEGDTPKNIREYGGIKINPNHSQKTIDNKFFNQALILSKEFDLPILTATSLSKFCHPKKIIKIADNNPDIDFISAHVGYYTLYPVTDEDRRNARSLENLYFDSSCTNFSSLKWAVEIFGPERILFGSDMPCSFPSVEIENIRLLFRKEYITKNEYNKIIYYNAKKLIS